MENQRVLEARRAAGTRAHHPVDGGRMRGFMSVAIWLSVLVIATGARALCGAMDPTMEELEVMGTDSLPLKALQNYIGIKDEFKEAFFEELGGIDKVRELVYIPIEDWNMAVGATEIKTDAVEESDGGSRPRPPGRGTPRPRRRGRLACFVASRGFWLVSQAMKVGPFLDKLQKDNVEEVAQDSMQEQRRSARGERASASRSAGSRSAAC